jgi:hypothetical protein
MGGQSSRFGMRVGRSLPNHSCPAPPPPPPPSLPPPQMSSLVVPARLANNSRGLDIVLALVAQRSPGGGGSDNDNDAGLCISPTLTPLGKVWAEAGLQLAVGVAMVVLYLGVTAVRRLRHVWAARAWRIRRPGGGGGGGGGGAAAADVQRGLTELLLRSTAAPADAEAADGCERVVDWASSPADGGYVGALTARARAARACGGWLFVCAPRGGGIHCRAVKQLCMGGGAGVSSAPCACVRGVCAVAGASSQNTRALHCLLRYSLPFLIDCPTARPASWTGRRALHSPPWTTPVACPRFARAWFPLP